MTTKIMTRILSSALLTQLVLLPDFLYAQADFYRGKTITIVHGRDRRRLGRYLRVKALVPFLQKYIPGNPTIVHEFMPGRRRPEGRQLIFMDRRASRWIDHRKRQGAAWFSSAVLGETGVQYDH